MFNAPEHVSQRRIAQRKRDSTERKTCWSLWYDVIYDALFRTENVIKHLRNIRKLPNGNGIIVFTFLKTLMCDDSKHNRCQIVEMLFFHFSAFCVAKQTQLRVHLLFFFDRTHLKRSHITRAKTATHPQSANSCVWRSYVPCVLSERSEESSTTCRNVTTQHISSSSKHCRSLCVHFREQAFSRLWLVELRFIILLLQLFFFSFAKNFVWNYVDRVIGFALVQDANERLPQFWFKRCFCEWMKNQMDARCNKEVCVKKH